MLKAETHQNHWTVTRINKKFAEEHGVVWIVKLKLESENNAQRELVQQIAKIALLADYNSLTESRRLNGI